MGLTRHTTGFHEIVRKSVDESRMSVWAVVSSPHKDRAGDIVEQAGIDPTVHKAAGGPVGFEHLRRKGREWVLPGPGDDHLPPVLVASAVSPDTGAYTLKKASLDDGVFTVAESFFDQHDRASSQAFQLVKDGTLTGTSVEIVPTRGYSDPLGRSPLEPRQALHIRKCSLFKFDFCAVPVQEWSLICKSIRELPPYAAQARRVVETGRVGGEAAHPAILKALSRFAAPGKSSTVTSGYAADPVRKAMPADDMTAAYTPDDAAPIDVDGADAPDSYPTADGLNTFADAIKAACDAAMATKGEHKKGMKALRKLCGKADALVQEAVAAALNVEDDLDAEDESEVEPTADETAAVDTADTDGDGLMKAISPRGRAILKAVKARRLSKAEVAAAPAVEPAESPEELAAARREASAAARRLAAAKRYAD